MAKQCKHNECLNDRFSHGYCRFHQYLRDDTKWDEQKKKYIEMRNRYLGVRGKYPVSYEDCIQKQSVKGIKETKEIQEIKSTLIKNNGNTCFFTGPTIGRLDAFHIFPKGKYPEYKTEPWNIVLSKRSINTTWDQGTFEDIMAIPNVERAFDIIRWKDNDPNKRHTGSFYEQLMNRKDK